MSAHRFFFFFPVVSECRLPLHLIKLFQQLWYNWSKQLWNLFWKNGRRGSNYRVVSRRPQDSDPGTNKKSKQPKQKKTKQLKRVERETPNKKTPNNWQTKKTWAELHLVVEPTWGYDFAVAAGRGTVVFSYSWLVRFEEKKGLTVHKLFWLEWWYLMWFYMMK